MKPGCDVDALLDLLLKSARLEAEPTPDASRGLSMRIAARWAAGGDAPAIAARLWERVGLRAALACALSGLVVGMVLHESWSSARWGARQESAQALSLMQLEELIWTP